MHSTMVYVFAACGPLDRPHAISQDVAAQYAAEWQAEAVSSDRQHILTSFGDPDSSWALTYNLFADRLLQTNVISQDVGD